MKLNGHIGFLFCCSLCVFLFGNAKAQLQQLPVGHSKVSSPKVSSRIQQEKLLLPFWDDFSSGMLDSSKWENHGTVTSYTIGINPPSQGVVLLDGVDERGTPYSANIRERGDGDRLISRPFDLSGLTQEGISSLFLSFYWQAGGKAEFPDADDFLELYFNDAQGNWQLIWDMQGGDLSKQQVFTQEFIRVPAEFIHADFRFKFQNRGRLSGPFDGWVLDYVFLNSGRDPSLRHFPDRAISKPPTAPLGKYNAVPFFEYNRNPEAYSGFIASQFNSLDNRFRAMEYTVQLRDSETGAVLQNINSNTPFNPVPLARERRDFISNPFESIQLDGEAGMDLQTLLYLTTGDGYLINQISQQDTTYHTGVDFRVNDTIRQVIPLRDYFAYDNNSVDYAAGINQRSGLLAVRYHIEEEAYISGVSINFTNFAQTGSPIELMVWNDLAQEPIFAGEHSVPQKESIQEISHFPLDTLLRVQGDFYIGFRQFTNDFLHVGLDKTTDNGSEIFYNVVGTWAQNQTVEGSLMVRPHLQAEGPAAAPPTAVSGSIKAYPNPVTDKLFLEGEMDEISVYDPFGRQINVRVEDYEQGKVLDFIGKQKGVYLIRTYINQKPTSIRILVK
jgi:hypothetical protein